MPSKWLIVAVYTLILAAVVAAARVFYRRLVEPCLWERRGRPNRAQRGG